MKSTGKLLAAACAITVLAQAQPAYADELFSGMDLISTERFAGHADLRLGIANGEPSWLDEGFGKARFGGDGDGFNADVELAEASLVWMPIFTWSLEGYVHAQYTEEQNPEVDLVEAYATYRAPPFKAGRFKLRGGMFYPPISLEHEQVAWRTVYSITPSAINTWIGEEVKVAGLEAWFERSIGEHRVSATLAGFQNNDTSGTLLSWRGWALHDIKTSAFTSFPLPDRPFGAFPTVFSFQAERTEPFRELDHRVGYYARLDWKAPQTVAFNILHYDNQGDRRSFDEGQISWETYFTNFGMTLDVSPKTLILAQGLFGRTIIGRSLPPIVDVKYRSAYVLVNHAWDQHSLSGRADWFETTDETFVALDNNNERGWALTAAYNYTFNKHARFMAEIMRISSDRPTRAEAGLAPSQDQYVFQLNWRIGF